MAFGGFGPGSSVPNSHGLLSTIHSDTLPHGVTGGDIIVGSGSSWAAYAIGADGTYLAASGGLPIWTTVDAGGTLSATLPVVDNALARWDGTTGTLIQNSEVLVTDAGDLFVAGDITASGTIGLTGNLTTSQLHIGSLEVFAGAWRAATTTQTIVLTATSTARTLVLPSTPVVGQKYTVKDGAGDSSSFPINVVASGGATIDGQADIDMQANYSAFSFVWNGSEWNIL